ncbi:MAG: GntR family transcriptional regulator [Akkermansiaceae bacterium]|nr:GntR family transcriptional regulator [Akkermansiaceae bacterium]MDP4721344.1 GntR family transcriptional regulator [Akkermansiaceae bacterium]MDP4779435.1 GntR family transcriptional regulator [Akkermansiaceae bacterium]MDP4846775.1 GntR family transcriptional regulator [Akkermansiaceae bacterium]MDP4897112.1 GntR family transcriptional regulator [Akkermansiaceae bacterium]
MPIYRTIREQITERLRSEVLSQHLAAGENLREVTLAKRYGVSRAPVRDALLQLTNEGLLVAKPNCGVKVAPLPDQTIQPLIVRLRREIEITALDRLFDRIDDVDLSPLQGILDDLRHACSTEVASSVAQCDMAFHRFIISATGENELPTLWLPVISRMMIHYSRHDKWMDSFREHEAIANAIQIKDHNLASRLLTKNIS